MTRAHICRRALLPLVVLLCLPAIASGSPPLTADRFKQAALQGFGDRQNSWAWSMQWWRGHLYVGTNRSWECASAASLHVFYRYGYPPTDPDIACEEDFHDLPLRAEIWRWTPPQANDTIIDDDWERVYQSPQIEIPGVPGKYVGLDVGYRGMTVFTEPDGTEALYVGALSSRFLGYDVPPPRILRSTDGVNFAPLPQDPGTVLGDFNLPGFRTLTSYKGRFFIQGGSVLGSGKLLEAADPRGGNNNFREVGPPETLVSSMASYNGSLYIGTRDVQNGYGVLKTDVSERDPTTNRYVYETVIEKAGYQPQLPDVDVGVMKVFDNRLYIGTDGTGTFIDPSTPGEIVRVNPDDSWDIVVGDERRMPAGDLKEPISGFSSGFGHAYNLHMWWMEVFDGNLYVGTFDSSTLYRNESGFPQATIGFDLYRTPDGEQFFPISVTGFDDKLNFGARTMAATPYGLFLGTANYYYGLKIYRGLPQDFKGFEIFVPMAQHSPIMR